MVGKAKLTNGPVGRMLFFLTLPMVFGIFSMSAFHLVDKYFIGKLGTAELAAMNFTMIDPGPRLQYVPDDAGIETCIEYGKKIGNAVNAA